MGHSTDITRLLIELREEDSSNAVERLYPLVYDELRRLARGQLLGERPDHTLQATALVHEAYLKLIDQTRVEWQNRAHFFALAARAIRRILVDHARTKGRQKRGGDLQRLSIDEVLDLADESVTTQVLALDEALESLAHEDEFKAQVVELRFFGGLSVKEVAAVLDSSVRTVERSWQFARAWLYRYLTQDEASDPA